LSFLNGVMCKSRNRASGNNANRAEWVAPEAAHIVVGTHGAEAICAAASYRASGRCADVGEKADTVTVYVQKHAAEAVAAKSAACGENGYCLADVPYHAVHKAFHRVYHDKPPIKIKFQKDCTLLIA
jgi:hypothetical protein